MRTKHGSITLCLISMTAFASWGCGASGEESVATAGDSPGMTWEALRASARLAPNGSLVVEGDMAFRDEAALYRFWQEDRAPGAGQQLTVATRVVGGVSVDDRWPHPDNFQLSYCVGSGFTAGQLAALLPALDAATLAWSRIAGVAYQRVSVGTCNSSTSSVVFDVQRDAAASFFGSAFFPGDPRSSRTLYLSDAAFTTSEGGRTLTGIVTHELGHSLGFRHEHIWTGCTGEGENSGGLGARQLTDLDQMSVMFYPQCRTPTGGGYQLTELDKVGSVSLYGLAPSLTTAVFAPR